MIPGARTTDGLVVYRFGTSLYFANASRLVEDVTALLSFGPSVSWFCLDGAAIGDVDYSAASVLTSVHTQLRGAGVRVVLSNIIDPARSQLDRYGFGAELEHPATTKLPDRYSTTTEPPGPAEPDRPVRPNPTETVGCLDPCRWIPSRSTRRMRP